MPRTQIASMLKKVVSKTISLEEGALLLNDLEKHSKDKDEICDLICDIYVTLLPSDTLAKTFIHIIGLTNNPSFERALEIGLEHPDEGEVLASIEGMSRYRDDVAKNSLIKLLAHRLPQVRKATGAMIIKKWGNEGIKIVITSGICHDDLEVISSACSILLDYGMVVVAPIIDAMGSMNDVSLLASAKLLLELKESVDIDDHFDKERVSKLIGVLKRIAIEKQPNLIISILEILATLKEKLAGYEDVIAAFQGTEHSATRLVAGKVLSGIGTDRARHLLSYEKIPLGLGAYHINN